MTTVVYACHDDAMPHIDPVVKQWELDTAHRVGLAVAARRKALGLTAVQLAARTAELGYPVSRTAVTKIETNARAGKLDVAELLVLAAALETPPGLLLYDGLVDAPVEYLPGHEATSIVAVKMLAGQLPLTESNEFGSQQQRMNLAASFDMARWGVHLMATDSAWADARPGTDAYAKAATHLAERRAEAHRAGMVINDG